MLSYKAHAHYSDKCFKTLESLKAIKSDLFDCGCPMKRPETKERCERIQWRLANNTCLGKLRSMHSPGVGQVIYNYPSSGYESSAGVWQQQRFRSHT